MAANWAGKDPGLSIPMVTHLLVSRLVGNGESQSKTRVFIDRTAAIFTAHSTYGRKSYGA